MRVGGPCETEALSWDGAVVCAMLTEVVQGEKVRGVVALMLLFLGGCATGPDFQRQGTVKLSPPEIVTWRPYAPYAYRRLCLLTFAGPQGMERLGTSLAQIYRQGLAQNGVFQAPTVVRGREPLREVPFDALPERSDCALVLTGTIERFHDGSGALPTVLEITVRIFDTEHETLLWEVTQKGWSFPAPDVDLFWNVIPGGGAADYRETGRWMARQLAFFFTGEKDWITGRETPWIVGGQGDGCED